MKPVWLRIAVPTIVCFIVATCFSKVSRAEELLPEVQQALTHDLNELMPISLEWERSRKHVESEEATLKRMGYVAIKAGELKPYKAQLLCDKDRYYCRIWRSSVNISKVFADGRMELDKENPFRITEDEASFDGEICYLGNSLELAKATGGIPMLRKAPLAKTVEDNPNHWYFVTDYLTWAGYDVPHSPSEIQNGVRSRVLVDLALGTLVSQEVNPNAVKMTIMIGDNTVNYELSPEKHYAVVARTERTKNGEIATSSRCQQFVQLGTRSVWLPEKISVDFHTWESAPGVYHQQPILTEEYEIRSWDVAPIEQSRFVLNYSVPGAAISDAVVKGAEKFKSGYVDYKVPADPKDLDAAVQQALSGGVPKIGVSKVLLIVNLIVLAAIGAFVWMKYGAR